MSPQNRRAIVLGATVLIAVLVPLRLVPLVVDWRSNAAREVDVSAQRLDALSRQAARIPVLADSLARIEGAWGVLRGRVLRGSSDDGALVDLMRRVHAHLATSVVADVSLARVKEGAEQAGPLTSVLLKTHFRSDLEGALDVIIAIENDPALWVAEVVLELETDPGPASVPEGLNVSVTVGGWVPS